MPWTQPPSLALCAEQCGARCCQSPGHLRVSRREAERMQWYASAPIPFRVDPGDARFVAPLVLTFGDTGGRCPLLASDNACTIYAQRPVACHRFPEQPHPECRVWPGEGA